MPFDKSSLAKGQRWRVHYTEKKLTSWSFDFTLNKKVASDAWTMTNCTSTYTGNKAHEHWWDGKSPNYIIVLLCSNVDHK